MKVSPLGLGRRPAVWAVAGLLLFGCDGSSSHRSLVSSQSAGAQTFRVCPGPDGQKDALIAFFEAREGDTIEFCAGQFDFDTGLVMTGKRGVTIQGAGREQTILSFKQSSAQDGISINNVDGITVQDLTIYDAPGNGLRLFRSKFVTVRRVKVGWSNADPASPNYDPSMQSWPANGSYAFYPVICRHVLIEDSISIGSSDAGVYVGQSSDILVRRTEAFHNVAGFEFENTYRAEFVDNVAHDNVGGFLVFDLPGRVQFGEKNLVHHNRSYDNNVPSFAPRGAIVGNIPAGTGMLVVATDQLEVYENEIFGNRTVGFAIVNYGLADPNESSSRYDFFPEGIHLYKNTFRDNGYSPQLPELSRDGCRGAPGIPAGLPGPNESPECLTNNASLLPLILMLKNGGKSAHIIWDGGVDVANGCTKVPIDRYGVALDKPNQEEADRAERPEPRLDERGRPNLYQFDPTPECKYNAWKFDDSKKLKRPENGLCIADDNTFENTRPEALLVNDFANVHFSTPDPTNPANLPPSSNEKPKNCPTVSDEVLAQFPPNLGSFTPNPGSDPRPSPEEIAAACGNVQPGTINADAVLKYDCPRLDQFGLFADPEDPRRDPNGRGVPFDLNTILFSDYASKYRFLFLPEGTKAEFQDHESCDTLNIYNCFTATLKFPVGTVFAKTFSFKNGDQEDVVETRLLIKRQRPAGDVYWVGLPYLWVTDSSGRHADLKIEGDTKSVQYDYDDPDPEVVDAQGSRIHYSGAVEKYAVPNAGACILCHNGDDLEAGSPPIGPKVRNLNKDHDYPDVGTMNQLAYLQEKGLLDLPDDPSRLEKMAKFNVPGSSGETPNSPADIHKRVRAYLEVNCMHCHNPAGNAQNSGLLLDAFNEPMDEAHGICKPPIAAGRAADFGNYDIQPGNAGQSILPHRLASVEPGIRMPPLSRSVQQKEAVELVTQWVNEVVSGFASADANTCGGNGLPALPLP